MCTIRKGKLLCFLKKVMSLQELHKDIPAPQRACLRNNMKSYLLKQNRTYKSTFNLGSNLKLGRIPMNMKKGGWKMRKFNKGKCHEILKFMARKESGKFKTHYNCHIINSYQMVLLSGKYFTPPSSLEPIPRRPLKYFISRDFRRNVQ